MIAQIMKQSDHRNLYIVFDGDFEFSDALNIAKEYFNQTNISRFDVKISHVENYNKTLVNFQKSFFLKKVVDKKSKSDTF